MGKEMTTLCTIYNVNYLDKGLALYNSLERHCKDFRLYVLAMDDKVFDVLTTLNQPHCIPVRLSDVPDDDLQRIKNTRKIGPLCWTCKSIFIKYIFDTYNTEYCSYLDTDLYFYGDAQLLIDEMVEKNASVQTVGHRFHWCDAKIRNKAIGQFCAGTVTFKNDENGNTLLDKWRKQCVDCCDITNDGIHYGDQKYIDSWCEDYDFTFETENLGAGVAPWNISQYHLLPSSDDSIKVRCRGKQYNMLFFHFEELQYIEKNKIQINAYMDWGTDVNLVNTLYHSYLKEVDECKDLLKEKFNIDILIKSHPGYDYGPTKRRTIITRLIEYMNLFSPKNFRQSVFHTIPSKLHRKDNIIYL